MTLLKTNVIYTGDEFVINHRPLLDSINQFAEALGQKRRDEYHGRNPANLNKIKQDIRCGKIAEFATSYCFRSAGIPCTIPDMKIYESPNWDDLFIEQPSENGKIKRLKVSVKSCLEQSDISWVFQQEDPKHHAFLVCCVVDSSFQKVTVKYITAKQNIKHLFAPLRNGCPNKVALYERHIDTSRLIQIPRRQG